MGNEEKIIVGGLCCLTACVVIGVVANFLNSDIQIFVLFPLLWTMVCLGYFADYGIKKIFEDGKES